MSTAQLSPGTVVDGKYTIGAPAYERSGAQSYEATDDQGRPVVLTAYDEACFSSGLVLERSLRELRQLQSLKSPRVASVVACGKLGAGVYEVVQPVPGTRLDAIVAGGSMGAPEAAAVIEQIGAGLLEAQKAGVIHRNLGPRVVFVGEQGVVVTSFSVGEPHGGKSFGPLDTIAPEQVEGKVVDQRTLIYNLAALMHMLLTGAPLFPGDTAAQLEAHLRADPPGEVHARLRRALGKEPRMRPMMLKQFLTELRAIGGAVARAPVAPSKGGPVAPPMPGSDLGGGGTAPSAGGGGPPGSTPSSRGWTMFMQADGDAPAAEAPAAAAPAAGAPAVGAPADTPAKPKTRGWTMFMDAADDEAKEGAKDEPAPAEKPAPKPSTRGWTMFMEDEEASPPASAEATPEPEPAPGGDPSKPSTRGWTMFMEDEEAGEAPSPATPVETPDPAEAPTPAAAAAPSVGGTAPKPSTRGWTMFMKADEETAAEAVQLASPPAAAPAVATPPAAAPAASPPAAAPAVATPPAAAPAATPPAAAPSAAAPQVGSVPVGGAAAPKSRGWTMFMEPTGEHATVSADASSEAATGSDAAAEPAAEAEPEAEPTPSVTSKRRGDADAPAKKRGWTMFMEKPISDTSKDELGGVVPSTGESNAKGWTVFSPVASTDGEAGAAAPAPGAEEAAPPASAASVEASPAEPPAEDWTRAKTVVVSGQPSSAPAPARVSTMVTPPGSGPEANPPPRVVTMVTPEQGAVASPMQSPPSGPVSEPLSGALAGPVTGPMSGPMSAGLPAPIAPQELEPAKKSNSAALVVVGILVAAAVAGAIVMLS